MKTRWFTAATALSILCFLEPGFGQGNLTPPGPPAPTMVTLSQIEPRTPVSSLPFTITAPGSYFITTNLTGVTGSNGITVLSDNVTLDLRGFTLFGVPGAQSGIFAPNGTFNFILENGTVRDWPSNAVDADAGYDAEFSRINCTDNGSDGLRPGTDAVIRHCIADGNGLDGFGGGENSYCVFEDCNGFDNGDEGFFTGANCLFRSCTADQNFGEGFNAFFTCTFETCIASYNGTGFYSPYDGCVFEHCNSTGNSNAGLLSGDDTTIRDFVSNYNGGDGIDGGNACVLDGCNSTENAGYGINVSNSCTLTDCVATTNAYDNILTLAGCALSHCSAAGSITGNGFLLGSANQISDSTALGNAINGINASDRTAIQSCAVSFNANAGIHLGVLDTVRQCSCANNGVFGILEDYNGDSEIIDNNCSYNGTLAYSGTIAEGAGIFVTNSVGCRIEGNTLDYNYAALVVAPANHAFVLRNSAAASISTNYVLGAGNSWGPIVDASAGGDISSLANSSHPDANFIH